MTVARWQGTITDASGNVIPQAFVEVKADVPGQPLVPLWSDRQGTAAIANPFQADSTGFAAFHVAGGAYQIRAFAAGFERIWRYVPIGLSSERDSFAVGGLELAFNTATADANPGKGNIAINTTAFNTATMLYVSKTGRLGEAIGSVTAGYFNSTNAVKAHVRLYSTASRVVVLEADVSAVLVNGGTYWKIALINRVGFAGRPESGDILDFVIDRYGDAGLNASGSMVTAEIDFGFESSRSRTFIVAVPGVIVSQKLVASPSLIMPVGVSEDELEMDMIAVAARVSASGFVTITTTSLGAPISGKRNINLTVY